MSQTGPGRAHRKGITLIELMELFPDEDSAERWFANIFWPDGVRCPACRSADIQTRPPASPSPTAAARAARTSRPRPAP